MIKLYFFSIPRMLVLLVSSLLLGVTLQAAPVPLPGPSAALAAPSFIQGNNPFTMTMAFPARLIVGDFDSDGDTDVLYQSTNTIGQGFGFMRNNGGGSYTDFPNANSSGTPFTNFDFSNQQLSNTGLFVFDYDADGDVDIVDRENTTNGTLGVWQNNNGSFAQGSNPFTMTMAFPARLIVGDFDSDGDTDVLYQSTNTIGQGFGFMRNNGGGSYTDFPNANSPGTPFTNFDFSNQQLSNTGLFVFDYDADGDVDIVDRENTTNGTLGVWQNNNGSFAQGSNPFTMTMAFPARLIVGDFDSDGDTDVLYQSTNTIGQGFGFMRNNGGGSYTDFPNANSSGTPFTNFDFSNQQLSNTGLFVFDYDADGDVDIVDRENTTNGTLGVWEQSGTPPALVSTVPVDNATNVSPASNLTLVFNRSVTTNAGSLSIIQTSNNSLFAQIDVTSGQVTGSGTTWVINPTSNLADNTAYAVRARAGTFKDTDGPIWRGINNNTTFNFTTGVSCTSPTPTLTASPSTTLTCAQTSLTLTASGGSTYTFAGPGIVSQSGNQAVVNAPGTYSVTAGVTGGCTGTATLVISRNTTAPTPTLTASPSTTLTCNQTSLTLTASGGNTYRFAGPGIVSQSGNQAVVNASGTYSVTVTNAATGCFSTTTATVSSNTAAPTVTINPSSGTLTCAQPSLLLAASGTSATYRWSNGSTTNPITVNTAGTYSVTATGSNGCTAVSSSVTIRENFIIPSFTATSGSACTGSQVTLTASGCPSGTINWPGGVTGSTFTTNVTGVYTATCTIGTCTTTTSGSATINPLPTPTLTVSGSGTLTCATPSLTLTAQGGNSYRFAGPGVVSQNAVAGAAVVNASGTYSVTVTNTTTGCFSTTTATVNSNTTTPTPTLTASPSTTLTCAQTSLTLTAAGGNTYRFAGPGIVSQSGNQAVVNASGTYSVTATNTTTGCFSTTSINISQTATPPTPTLTASPSATLTCAVTSITLTASGGTSYAFAGPGIVSRSGSQAVVNVSGTYSVTVTNTATGCFSTTSINISQNTTAPTPSVSANPSTTLTCAVTTITLAASGGNNYRFAGPGIVSQSGNQAVVNASGTYSVTVTNTATGCFSTTTIGISQNTTAPTPTLTANPSTTLTCAQTSLTLTASGGNTYRFAGPGVVSQSGNQAVVNASGTYSVTVTNAATGCFSTTTIGISQNTTAPTATLTASSPVVCAPSAITLTAGGGTQYRFSGPGLSQNGTSNTAVVAQTGTYSVTVTGANGCLATNSVSVTVNPQPSAPSLTGASLTGASLTVVASTTPLSLTPYAAATPGNTLIFYGPSGLLSPPNADISTPGVYSFSAVQVSQQGCASPATPFSLTVLSPLPPVSQTVCRTGTVVMNVLPNGVRYQWYRVNGSVSIRLTDVSGVQRGTNTSSLTLISVQTSSSYTCQVTYANGTVQTFGPFAVNIGLCGGREAASNEPVQPIQIRVLSNPLTDGRLRAVITGADNQPLQIELYNQRGYRLHEQHWIQAGTEQVVDLDVSQQPAGMLLLRAHTAQQSQTVKVIKE